MLNVMNYTFKDFSYKTALVLTITTPFNQFFLSISTPTLFILLLSSDFITEHKYIFLLKNFFLKYLIIKYTILN